MSHSIQFHNVEDKIISVRNQYVILDSDVAELYGVETRDVNKAVKNNSDKFPKGYIFELNKDEKKEVVENFHHLEKLKYPPVSPKAFTEKGLYMLATILKSAKATQTTLAIVETYTKIRELSRSVSELSQTKRGTTKIADAERWRYNVGNIGRRIACIRYGNEY